MLSVGDRLRAERETRNTTLEELSGSTGIGLSYLEALEHNEFEALPGAAFGKLYIRAYAEVLGFDPGPLIADYDRERYTREQQLPPEARRPKRILVPPPTLADELEKESATDEGEPEPLEGAPADTVEAEPPEPEVDDVALRETVRPSNDVKPAVSQEEPPPVAATEEAAKPPRLEPEAVPHARERVVPEETATVPRWRPALVAAAAIVIVVLLIGFVFFGGSATTEEAGNVVAEPAAASTGVSEQVEPQDPAPEPRGASTPTARAEAPVEAVAEPPPSEPPGASAGLRVDVHGVGRGVANHRLQGETDRFQEGDVAWFYTRVLGGRRGEQIRHVWLREGKWMQTIELRLGGPHWRTQSSKTLWAAGNWTVEARDAEGRVLAASTFTCTPR